jgi:hypothetical protein
MKTVIQTICCSFTLIFFLTACNENKTTVPATETRVKSASTTAAKEAKPVSEKAETSQPVDDAAVATITAPAYVAKIHKAIAFVPKNDGIGLMKVKPGHHFVVLDMSVRNTSAKKEVDMGQILLNTKVSDEKGKEYRFSAMAVAAYTLDNPDPQHQAQYNAMWGKLKPGDFYRTVVFGLEVPEGHKNFVLSMGENDDALKDGKRYEVKFSTQP